MFLVREGLRSILQRHNGDQVVGETDESVDVLTHIQALTPDLAILAADLRPLSGWEIARQVSHLSPATHVLLLGKPAGEAQFRKALGSGIAGYIAEQADADELLRAIDQACQNRTSASRLRDHDAAGKRSRACRLSEREEAVTRLLALGYTGKEIAAQFRLSPKTIETYKSRSLEKLGITSRTGIVQYALEKGWLSSGALAESLADER